MNNINSNKKGLSLELREELLGTLKARFEQNMNRHREFEWAKVQEKLEGATQKLWSLNEMERTGGEPDVVDHDQKTGEYIFYDCSTESPKGRRSVCYDRVALEARKAHKPENNALDIAAEMGIELLTEEQYRELQQLGTFDTKTSSWIITPANVRKLGGALFADRRKEKATFIKSPNQRSTLSIDCFVAHYKCFNILASREKIISSAILVH